VSITTGGKRRQSKKRARKDDGGKKKKRVSEQLPPKSPREGESAPKSSGQGARLDGTLCHNIIGRKNAKKRSEKKAETAAKRDGWNAEKH